MDRTPGPFEYYADKFGGVSADQIRRSAETPMREAAALQSLSLELGRDAERVLSQVEGEVMAGTVANPRAAQGAASALAARGLFAGALIARFAADVETFDTTVEQINADYRTRLGQALAAAKRSAQAKADARARQTAGNDPAASAPPVAVHQAPIAAEVEAGLRPRYRAAEATLDDRASVVAARLAEGPTPRAVRDLVRAGLLPLSAAQLFPGLTLTPADIRVAEQNAAQNLLERFKDTWGGFGLPSDKNPTSLILWGLQQAGFGGSQAASWMRMVEYGIFRPLDARGRITSPASMTFLARMRAGLGRFPTGRDLSTWERLRGFDREGNWKAKGANAAERAWWTTGAKWLSRGGTALTAVSSGWEEWNDAARYPSDERVGRTAGKAAATAGGAWAGAELGGTVGASVGSIVPGPGTVIGAGVGGVIGGFAGSEAGAWVGDRVEQVSGEVGDKVGDAVDTVGDVASKLNPFG